ncbi:unannotated protein [freshwater metagenome]|uniref:Unannotated protein n=1 Tax=freshwater metagenome TaxID=449393 RepID=A0A6J6AP40_9ZZZZ
MCAEEDHSTVITTALKVGQRFCAGERVIACLAHAMVANDSTFVDVPKMLFALEHNHRGCRCVTMNWAVAAIATPTHDHVEGSGVEVMTQDCVVVIDLVRATVN